MWKPIILDVECIVCNKSLQKINHDPREVSRKMGKIINRRSRTPNWSLEEKQYLLELINERKTVITRTNSGPNFNEEKDLAWNEIMHQMIVKFGSKFHGSTIKKVKTQWQNMRRIAREEITFNGPQIEKYTKQSMQVCQILDMVKDGVLVLKEGFITNVNDTMTSAAPTVEIKTERIDEDLDNLNQPSCSSMGMEIQTTPDQVPEPTENANIQPELEEEENPNNDQSMNQCETSSFSNESNCESPDFEPQEPEIDRDKTINETESNDSSDLDNAKPSNPYSRIFREFVKFTAVEKQLKLESLKEERQVVRAMRETAELNKIIAEERLKHVLWIKKKETE